MVKKFNIDQDEDVLSEDRVFEQGKLWIKLEIPKQEEQDEEKVEEEDHGNIMTTTTKNYSISSDGKRVCNFCNKEFRSGKALGGHMRIHVIDQSKKKHHDHLKVHHHNFKPNTKQPSCMICGKGFRSMKSLFGHMRCHPDRLWRGINPPTSSSSIATSSLSSSLSDPYDHDDVEEKSRVAVVDLTESLKGWHVTARRGRRAPVSNEDDHQLREAVDFLMILANGKKNYSSKKDDDQEEEKGSNEVVNGDSVTKSDGQHDHGHSTSSDNDDRADINYNNKNKKKRRKLVKLCDLQIAKNVNSTSPVITTTPPVLPDYKYRCNTCDKSFPTGQALGGHKSSHNKPKTVVQSSGDPSPNQTIQMKDHSQVDSSKHTSGRRMLTFDLNEAPPTSIDEIGLEYTIAR